MFEALGRGIKALKLIKVQIFLFNHNFSLIVYHTKLIALAAALVGGFGGLRLIHRNLPFAFLYGNCFIVGTLSYIIPFNRTYQISENVNELKREILASAENLERVKLQVEENKAQTFSSSPTFDHGSLCWGGKTFTNQFDTTRFMKVTEYKKTLRSIQRLGIQAGGFNYVERESTLIFLNYVFQQILSLLLAFN